MQKKTRNYNKNTITQTRTLYILRKALNVSSNNYLLYYNISIYL